ncbi:MAG TPA: hypothetical protein VN607_09380 [Gemmatimonadaceae bacterium]|nr:hypothetical protein [Gemmatimonadaceae bacterium]
MTTYGTPVGDCLLEIATAAKRLADATMLEMQLEDERALVKDAGIRHLVETQQERSATAAEKNIEKYPPYMEHRAKQYEAVRDRILARAAYDAAVLGARLTCELGEALSAVRPMEAAGDLRRAG